MIIFYYIQQHTTNSVLFLCLVSRSQDSYISMKKFSPKLMDYNNESLC